MGLSVEEFKEAGERGGWRCERLTEGRCSLCGGNEWCYSSSVVVSGELYIGLACATCPTKKGPCIGPIDGPYKEMQWQRDEMGETFTWWEI